MCTASTSLRDRLCRRFAVLDERDDRVVSALAR